ncbi:MAG: hypothetical protein Q7U28_08045 [Aquabacterium sp.]|nr:hypothetical protein [Aquabacterium sp.]
MNSPYATAAETAALIRPSTPDERWLHEQLDRIDPHRHEMGSAGDTPALVKLVFELRDSATQLQPKQEPYQTIAMGHGVIEVGDATWHGLPALWFGNDGQGLGFQRDRNEEPKPGETIIVFTFANIKGLEAIEFAVERVRRKLEARESESPYGLDCADPSLTPPPPESATMADDDIYAEDKAVDSFAKHMKRKLCKAREKGKSGWQDRAWTPEQISQDLREHVEKGDPVDVANYCMFLAARQEFIYPQPPTEPSTKQVQP